jgi:hypothetical protein
MSDQATAVPCISRLCQWGKWNAFQKRCHFLDQELACTLRKLVESREQHFPAHMRTVLYDTRDWLQHTKETVDA